MLRGLFSSSASFQARLVRPYATVTPVRRLSLLAIDPALALALALSPRVRDAAV